MTVRFPDAWPFLLLALAAFRLYRLGARDTISEPVRARLSYPDDAAVTLDSEEPALEVVGDGERSKGWRVYAATLIRCAWCGGFYVSAGVWVAWDQWPSWTLFLATPFALSAVLGLAKKQLDP